MGGLGSNGSGEGQQKDRQQRRRQGRDKPIGRPVRTHHHCGVFVKREWGYMQKGPKQKNGQKAPLSTGAVGIMPALLCRVCLSALPGEMRRRKGAPYSFPISWYRKRIAA